MMNKLCAVFQFNLNIDMAMLKLHVSSIWQPAAQPRAQPAVHLKPYYFVKDAYYVGVLASPIWLWCPGENSVAPRFKFPIDGWLLFLQIINYQLLNY